MVYFQSIFKVLDNSGINSVKFIGIKKNKKKINFGDVIIAVVKKCSSRSKIKKGKIVYGLVVNLKKSILRYDNSRLSFDRNAVVIINKDKSPLGTTIFGAIPYEIKEKGFIKVSSIAREII